MITTDVVATNHLCEPLLRLLRHIEERLVDASFLEHWREFAQHGEDLAACDTVPPQDRLLVLAVEHFVWFAVLAQSIHVRLRKRANVPMTSQLLCDPWRHVNMCMVFVPSGASGIS